MVLKNSLSKSILFIVVLAFQSLAFSQQVRELVPVVIKGKILNAKIKSLHLSQFDGKMLVPFCEDSLNADGTFLMHCNIPSKDIF